jgi:hypothetical protein
MIGYKPFVYMYLIFIIEAFSSIGSQATWKKKRKYAHKIVYYNV